MCSIISTCPGLTHSDLVVLSPLYRLKSAGIVSSGDGGGVGGAGFGLGVLG
jgi:hypothetical protein